MPKLNCSVDMSGLNDIIKNLNRLEEVEVEIGYNDEQHGDDTFTNETLGSWMETGTRNPEGGMHIPPRPALFRGAHILAWEGGLDKPSEKVVAGAMKGNFVAMNKALEDVGEEGVASIQEAVDRGGFKKLADSTIRLKKARGSQFPTTALIDTGELYQSLTYKINNKGD